MRITRETDYAVRCILHMIEIRNILIDKLKKYDFHFFLQKTGQLLSDIE